MEVQQDDICDKLVARDLCLSAQWPLGSGREGARPRNWRTGARQEVGDSLGDWSGHCTGYSVYCHFTLNTVRLYCKV